MDWVRIVFDMICLGVEVLCWKEAPAEEHFSEAVANTKHQSFLVFSPL